MAQFHHRPLPDTSAFLAGRGPVTPGVGVQTEQIQIYYRREDDLRSDEQAHAHEACDEFFVVLGGSITFEIEGEEHVVRARELCHFPPGVFHRIAAVSGPLEALVMRAPSVDDKVYRPISP